MKLLTKVRNIFSKPKPRPWVADYGMLSYEGNKAVADLLSQVYEIQLEEMIGYGPEVEAEVYRDVVETLSRGLSVMSLEYPEVSEAAVRENILMVIGEEFRPALF